MKLTERKRVATLAPEYVAKVKQAQQIVKHPFKVCLNPDGMTDAEARQILKEFAAL
tara:strand:- start:1720 stop:1887 length:168 start_codon:yes stop_codon:yes gene_type:complete